MLPVRWLPLGVCVEREREMFGLQYVGSEREREMFGCIRS